MSVICFELERNGERVARAGIPGHAVLSATFTWVRSRRGVKPPARVRKELTFGLSGLDSNVPPGEHVGWAGGPMEVGDEFVLRVVDADAADPPVDGRRRKRRDPSDAEMLRLLRRNEEGLVRDLREIRRKLRKLEGTAGGPPAGKKRPRATL